MKRLVALIIMLMVLVPCFSSSKKLYDNGSDEYKLVRKLCILSGVLPPSSVSPMTEDELEISYMRIDYDKLSPRNREEYLSLGRIFSDKEKDFDFVIEFNPAINAAKGLESLSNKEFLNSYSDSPSLMYYGFTASLFDNAFIEMYNEFSNDFSRFKFDEDGNKIDTTDSVHQSSFEYLLSVGPNGLLFKGKSPVDRFEMFPSFTRAALGMDGFSMLIGRTKQSFGSGITGNLLIGDNFRYQEVLSLAFFNPSFGYRLNLTHFDAQASDHELESVDFSNRQNIRLIHRGQLDLNAKFRAVLDLGIMLYVPGGLDLRYLTPMMFVHNWYNMSESITLPEDDSHIDEANNAIAVEIEAGLLIDQIGTIEEAGNVGVPDALAGLINISYFKSFKEFDAEFFAECYYSMPSVYLNKKMNPDGTPNRNFDWVGGYVTGDWYGDLDYVGHRYGPDVFAAVLGADLEFADIALRSRNILEYRVKGEKDMFSEYTFDSSFITGVPEHRIFLKSYNSKKINEKLTVNLDLGMSVYLNHKNEKGSKEFIPQASIGVNWTIL